MTLAMRPTPIAMQSKAMWMAVQGQLKVNHCCNMGEFTEMD